MSADSEYKPLTDTEREVVAAWKSDLDAVGSAVGSWETKSECRPKGLTLWLKFDNSVDVLTVTGKVVSILNDSPANLNKLIGRLLAADAEIARLRSGRADV